MFTGSDTVTLLPTSEVNASESASFKAKRNAQQRLLECVSLKEADWLPFATFLSQGTPACYVTPPEHFCYVVNKTTWLDLDASGLSSPGFLVQACSATRGSAMYVIS